MAEQKKIKIKRKEWYTIIAGSLLKNTVLGQTYLPEPAAMLGREITVNLMQVTNEPRNQNINLKFLINEIKDNNGIAEVIGYEIMPSSVRRLLRKEKKKVEMSFVCETSDKIKVRIKPITTIKKTTKGSTQSALRKLTREFLTSAIQKMSYDNLVSDMINYKLQDALKHHMKKIYPLKQYEIRQMLVVRQTANFGSEESAVPPQIQNEAIEETKSAQ